MSTTGDRLERKRQNAEGSGIPVDVYKFDDLTQLRILKSKIPSACRVESIGKMNCIANTYWKT